MAGIGAKDPGLVGHTSPIRSRFTRSSSDQSENEQKDHRADERADDLTNQSRADVDAEPWQKPAGDEGADDTNDDVADEAKAIPLHDLTGGPACDRPHHQQNNQCLGAHDVPSRRAPAECECEKMCCSRPSCIAASLYRGRRNVSAGSLSADLKLLD